jgi:hypothetical protein
MKGMRESQPRCSGRMASSTQHQQYLRPLIGALALLLLVGTSQAAGGWVNLGTRSFSRLCPQHIGGDREFNGHGPEVEVIAELTAVPTTRLSVCFYMHQVETRHDWSEAELNRCFWLYTAPSGKQITQIWNATEFYLFYVDNDHAEDRFFPPDNLVREFRIKGDTSGKDIGNCTSDDAYLSVILESINVWVE